MFMSARWSPIRESSKATRRRRCDIARALRPMWRSSRTISSSMHRRSVDAPILIGSGIDVNNAATFADADGVIVGTALKRDGKVDQSLVERVIRAFKMGSDLTPNQIARRPVIN